MTQSSLNASDALEWPPPLPAHGKEAEGTGWSPEGIAMVGAGLAIPRRMHNGQTIYVEVEKGMGDLPGSWVFRELPMDGFTMYIVDVPPGVEHHNAGKPVKKGGVIEIYDDHVSRVTTAHHLDTREYAQWLDAVVAGHGDLVQDVDGEWRIEGFHERALDR